MRVVQDGCVIWCGLSVWCEMGIPSGVGLVLDMVMIYQFGFCINWHFGIYEQMLNNWIAELLGELG